MIETLKMGSWMWAMRCGSGSSAGCRPDNVAIGTLNSVRDARRRGDEGKAEFPLESLLDDLHVQQAEEAAATETRAPFNSGV